MVACLSNKSPASTMRPASPDGSYKSIDHRQFGIWNLRKNWLEPSLDNGESGASQLVQSASIFGKFVNKNGWNTENVEYQRPADLKRRWPTQLRKSARQPIWVTDHAATHVTNDSRFQRKKIWESVRPNQRPSQWTSCRSALDSLGELLRKHRYETRV